jgi:hypothetical protein
MPDLHRRIHNASHFQIDLIDVGAELMEHAVSGALVSCQGRNIKVSTAWDENGRVPPHVEIAVSALEVPGLDGFPPLVPIVTLPFETSGGGIEVGNWISNDFVRVELPKGRYHVLVSLDVAEPFKARRVHFHFWPASPP